MRFAVALHNVRSVHNVGSIFRTADAAGAEKVWLCGITPPPLDRLKNLRPDFAKVALGAQDYIPWESAKSTVAALRRLKREGWLVFAVEQAPRAVPYHKLPRAAFARKKFCLVLGDEVRGLPPSVLAQADRILEIPMFGKKESLNVAVAFGIVAFGPRSRTSGAAGRAGAGRRGMVRWKRAQ